MSLLKIYFLSICLISCFVLVNCAGMINGDSQMINIDCNVKGAKITYTPVGGNTLDLGTSPYIGSIPRKKGGGVIKVSKDGEEKSQVVTSKISMVFFLNFLIPSGTFSSTTDLNKGTAYEYSPSNYYINLDIEKSSGDESSILNNKGIHNLANYDFERDSKIKRFVMMNFQQVSSQIAKSKGDYLDELLYTLFEIKQSQADYVIADLKQILKQANMGVVSFGEEASKYYHTTLKG